MLGQECLQPRAGRTRLSGARSFSPRHAAHPDGTRLGRPVRYRRNAARHLRAGASAMPQPVPSADLLAHLIELLADKDKAVRAEVVRAIDQVGSPPASLLAPFASRSRKRRTRGAGRVLQRNPAHRRRKAIPWVAASSATADDSAAEAALAIAGTHSAEGLPCSAGTLLRKTTDPWWRSVLLSAIALTRQDAALEFLLDLVRTESLDAEAAIEALLRSMPSAEIIQRLEKLTVAEPALWPASSPSNQTSAAL